MGQSTPSSSPEHFHRWWDERRRLWGEDAPLREQFVRDVFGLLACALGSLRREDLLALVGDSAEAGWGVEEVLLVECPFVIGYGEPLGYVISDPGLREYLHDRLTERERTTWEGRFLDWGRGILRDLEVGKLSPEAAPPYAIQYYGAHLERTGGRDTDLFSLVSDAWRRAWNSLEGCYSGFLVDVERAWRAGAEIDRLEAEKDHIAPQLGMEVRCALCKSSVVSLASQIPPLMLGALVEKKVWTPAQGLGYTLSAPEDQRPLAVLGPYLSDELLHRALVATLAIEDWQVQAHQLSDLAPYLSEAMLRETLPVVVGNLEKWALWGELGKLASHLSPESVREVLIAAQGLKDWRARTDAMVALTPHLSEERLQEALSTARKLENVGAQGFVLAKMIPHLPQADRAGLVTEVLKAVQSAEDGQYSLNALIQVIRYLPQAERDRRLLELLAAVSELEEEVFRVVALDELACYMTEPLVKEALEVVRDIKASWAKAYALDKMAPYLPVSLLREAFVIAKAIEDKSQRADTLASLAPHMSESLLEEALKEVLAIDKQWGAAEAQAKLVPHLPERLLRVVLTGAHELEDKGLREKVLAALALQFARLGYQQEADELLTEVEGTWAWAEVIPEIAPHLQDPQLRKMVSAAETIEDVWRRAEALTRLAPYVPLGERAKLAEEILTVLGGQGTPSDRSLALPKLVPHLEGDLLQKAVEVAQEIDDEHELIEMLIALAVHLVEPGDGQNALSMVRAIEDAEGRAVGLTELVTHLPEPERRGVLVYAMDAARRLESRWTRAHLLAELAKSLPPTQRDEVLSEALETALGIEVGSERDRAIAWLAPLLPEPLVREALSSNWIVEHGSFALSCLAQRLGELGFSDEGLAAVKEIEDDAVRAEAIAGLAPHLSEALVGEALATVALIEDHRSRAIGLAGLANHLPGDEGVVVFREALEAVEAIADERERSSALRDLAPYLSEGALKQAVAAANAIEHDTWRETALEGLASRCCELAIPEDMLNIAQTLENDWARAAILARLAPYLSEETLLEALTLAKKHPSASTRREILASLSPELAKLPRSQLFRLWQGILPVLAARPREELLPDLRALMPVIAVLGGRGGLTDTALAVGEVGRWWL